MPASHAYAERLRARLPRTLQEEREAAGLSRYALEKKCDVSREMIGCIECGDSIPTLHPGARLAHGMGMTLATFMVPGGAHRAAVRVKSPPCGVSPRMPESPPS